jgi:hypothetical protein
MSESHGPDDESPVAKFQPSFTISEQVMKTIPFGQSDQAPQSSKGVIPKSGKEEVVAEKARRRAEALSSKPNAQFLREKAEFEASEEEILTHLLAQYRKLVGSMILLEEMAILLIQRCRRKHPRRISGEICLTLHLLALNPTREIWIPLNSLKPPILA